MDTIENIFKAVDRVQWAVDFKQVEATLSNDEVSTDDELRDFFREVTNLCDDEIEFYITQRDDFLRNPIWFLTPFKK